MFEMLEERRAAAEAVAGSYADHFRHLGFQVEGRVAEGSSGQQTVDLATAEQFGLIVVGAGRRSWLGNALLGSTSNFVLHSSPVSVLVVHEQQEHEGPARILVATDGSRGAFAAVDDLGRIADPAGCAVDVIAVQPSPSPLASPMFGMAWIPPSGPGSEELETALAERAERDLSRTIRRLEEAGFTEVRGSVAVGHPTQLILKEAESINADLVVMGSRGLGAVRRALMGSVSDHVSRHAPATLVARSIPS
jgi:nucleotide-binding universal stress UspA family protein